ncbi:MAG: hypothetical protein R3195_09755 [Gemmatimonadota bacterium]|nr:hypothetical protein [Gemmatimonadota bacterium]
MTSRSIALAAALLFPDGTSGTAPAQDAGPRWTEVAPRGETCCALGTPFRFFHSGLEEGRAHVAGGRACVAADGGDVRVAQITSDLDAIQSACYTISGSREWRSDTYALLDEISSRLPEFRSFVVSGSDHGLFRTDDFYDYSADGSSLRDWVADLVEGAHVPDVRCAACAVP